MSDETEQGASIEADTNTPIETPTDGSDISAPDAGTQAPATEPAIETGEVNG